MKSIVVTSNYAKANRVDLKKFMPVQISVTVSRWGYKPDYEIPVLTPHIPKYWEEGVTIEKRKELFLKRLNDNEDEAISSVGEVIELAKGKIPMLLCHCAKGKPCHRRWFAEWYQSKTGEIISEL